MEDNEEKGNEGATQTEVNTGNRISLVEEARLEREKLEKVRDELRAENDRLEQLRASDMLGGSSTVETQAKPKEISATDYSDAALRGEVPTVE